MPNNEISWGGGYNLEEAKESLVGGDDTEQKTALAATPEPSEKLIKNDNPESVQAALAELGKDSQIEVFADAIDAVEERFGAETADEIRQDLARIDDIELATIGAIEDTEAMTGDTRFMMAQLEMFGVNADNLTVDEADQVIKYATGATAEIRETKIDRVYGAIITSINGVRNRRDGHEPAFFNEEEYRRKTELQDKYIRYKRGELDLERGFDPESAYEHAIENGAEPSTFLRQHIEESELEDLMDEGLLDEGDCYVYGPFTENDRANVEIYKKRTWSDITNQRFVQPIGKREQTSLSRLIDMTVRPNSLSIDEDLTTEFIASEIMQSRRLNAKNLMKTSSAIAIKSLSDFEWVASRKDGTYEADETLKAEYGKMRKAVSFLAYYSGKILDYSSSELKKRFGSNRPLKTEFFEEVAETMLTMPNSRTEYLDKNKQAYLTKMDEHLRSVLDSMAVLSNEGESSLFSDELD